MVRPDAPVSRGVLASVDALACLAGSLQFPLLKKASLPIDG